MRYVYEIMSKQIGMLMPMQSRGFEYSCLRSLPPIQLYVTKSKIVPRNEESTSEKIPQTQKKAHIKSLY
uniref:Uncharacterized protein n=1 Tax=Falco tinnunculus TaxID=100819 RepID=A0A8C4TX86_FALTI